jgi:hypothetical protein
MIVDWNTELFFRCFYRVILEVRSIFLGGDIVGDGEKKVHMNMYLLLND